MFVKVITRWENTALIVDVGDILAIEKLPVLATVLKSFFEYLTILILQCDELMDGGIAQVYEPAAMPDEAIRFHFFPSSAEYCRRTMPVESFVTSHEIV